MNNRRAPRGRHEEGQALIFLIFGMTVVFIIGVIAVDIGLWLSERRGAQKDADTVALAAAWELLSPAATEAGAVAAGEAWLAANDQQGNAELAQPIVVDDSCFNTGRLDGVTVDINHGTRGLFASIFDVAAPLPGAHAKACAGAAEAPGIDLTPFQIDRQAGPCFNADGTPNYTEICGIEFGAQGGRGTPSSRGLVDLSAPEGYCSDSQGGVQNVAEYIEWGAPSNCLVNESDTCSPARVGPWIPCVAVQPGNPQEVLKGVRARLSREGLCDSDGDGIDGFEESVQLVFDSGDPFTSLYEARDCDPSTEGKQASPRLITIIILPKPPTGSVGNQGYPIDAFAAFHLFGCLTEAVPNPTPDQIDAKCAGPGRGAPPGRAIVYGKFVKLIVTGTGITAPSNSTTQFGIALVE
jgi:hypothetical protein